MLLHHGDDLGVEVLLERLHARDLRVSLVANRNHDAYAMAPSWLAERFQLPLLATLPERSRALGMSAVGDFDGDGTPDLAIPSFDRATLRIVTFKPVAQDIASVKLPSDARTDIGVIAREQAPPALLLGLADGTLVMIRPD